jgi:hypothetical protein
VLQPGPLLIVDIRHRPTPKQDGTHGNDGHSRASADAHCLFRLGMKVDIARRFDLAGLFALKRLATRSKLSSTNVIASTGILRTRITLFPYIEQMKIGSRNQRTLDAV